MDNNLKKIKVNLSDKALNFFEAIIDEAKAHEFGASPYVLKRNIYKLNEAEFGDEALKFACICSLMADLLEQGWEIKDFDARDRALFLKAPSLKPDQDEDVSDVKERIRAGLTALSNKQLASEQVIKFIKKLECPIKFKNKEYSIFSVVDNGKELSSLLKEVDNLPSEEKADAINAIIDPVIEICESKKKCSQTGLYLQDIWRYFRYTWSLEYKPTPGRTMRVLIRNRARENWPIIGIAMIASPAMNLYVRDEWIGWRLDDIYSGLVEKSLDAKNVASCLFQTMKEAIDNIRTDDLLTDKEIETPDEYTLLKLEQTASAAYSNRQNELVKLEDSSEDDEAFLDIRHVKDSKNIDWHRLSETSLYKKKRAETLAPLLKAYWHFKGANVKKEPETALYTLLSVKAGRDAVSTALNELRKARLSSQVADVSVCGSITPYNELIGGKLVTLLMGSEEIRRFYKKRYKDQVSEIASQLAGRPINKSSDLLVLTTTSLYGVGSSQYNRLKLRKGFAGLEFDCEWKKLRLTEGYGVTHLSNETVAHMRKLCRSVYGAQRINSVFGEGSSPKTRLVTNALGILGISDTQVMKHGLSRIVYAYEYFPGAKSRLTGFDGKTKQQKAPSSDILSRAWIERWCVNRVAKQKVMARLDKLSQKSVSDRLWNRINNYKTLHSDKILQGGDDELLSA